MPGPSGAITEHINQPNTAGGLSRGDKQTLETMTSELHSLKGTFNGALEMFQQLNVKVTELSESVSQIHSSKSDVSQPKDRVAKMAYS